MCGMSCHKRFSKAMGKNTKSIQFSSIAIITFVYQLNFNKQAISLKTYCRSQFEGDQDVQFGEKLESQNK